MESILLVHLWKFMTLSCCILLRMRNDSDKSCRENQNTYYEGRLISNAHSEIFCQRSTVAMHAQCVLVATTLLHSGAKFHSFLYTGSKTVRVNVESCYGGMSTRVKQRAVTEFLSAENVMTAEIHHRLQAVYGENTVNRTTVNRWAIKFRECEPGRANIVDQRRSGRPASMTDDMTCIKSGWWTDQAWPL